MVQLSQHSLPSRALASIAALVTVRKAGCRTGRFLPVVAILLGIVASGCAGLSTPLRHQYTATLVQPPSKDLSFSDERMDMRFTISAAGVRYACLNKTPHVMRLLWEKATIMRDSIVEKAIPATRFGEISKQETFSTPTTIPPGSLFSEAVMPCNDRYIAWGSRGGFTLKDFFNADNDDFEALKAHILTGGGRFVRLFLPIKIQGEVFEYTFVFEVTDVREAAE